MVPNADLPPPAMKEDAHYIPSQSRGVRRTALATFLGLLLVIHLSFWTPLRKLALQNSPGNTTLPAAPPSSPQNLCRQRYWRAKAASYCNIAGEETPKENDDIRDPLQVFQVHTPVRIPQGGRKCELLLMNHTFGWSYGQPFIGNYLPPECEWQNVVFNLTMTSRGRQYDRLAMMFLGDVEVWRTSTAEPTSYGIISSFEKDMTHLRTLLRSPQKIIFDLGNLVNDIYTGSFNVTLSAIFFDSETVGEEPAHQVLPISARRSGKDQPSHFSLPSQTAMDTFKLPANAIKGVVSISASGSAEEEFYYTNVPSSYANTFNETVLPGRSPFREIQLYIDNQLAGVVWPMITVFTGGILPSLWRPVVGLNTFDLPEYKLDITPFLPILLDNNQHNIELRILSYDSATNSLSPSLGNDWLVSARLHIWTDPDPTWRTTGTTIQRYTPPPAFDFSPLVGRSNESLTINLSASRAITLISTINTSEESNKPVTWMQSMSYSSAAHIKDSGDSQFLRTHVAGMNTASHLPPLSYRWPFTLQTDFVPHSDSEFEIRAELQHGLQEVCAERSLSAEVRGNGNWTSGKGGLGWTSEIWADVDAGREGYARKVEASGDLVVDDWEDWGGQNVEGVLKEICGSCTVGSGEGLEDVVKVSVLSASGKLLVEMEVPDILH